MKAEITFESMQPQLEKSIKKMSIIAMNPISSEPSSNNLRQKFQKKVSSYLCLQPLTPAYSLILKHALTKSPRIIERSMNKGREARFSRRIPLPTRKFIAYVPTLSYSSLQGNSGASQKMSLTWSSILKNSKFAIENRMLKSSAASPGNYSEKTGRRTASCRPLSMAQSQLSPNVISKDRMRLLIPKKVIESPIYSAVCLTAMAVESVRSSYGLICLLIVWLKAMKEPSTAMNSSQSLKVTSISS